MFDLSDPNATPKFNAIVTTAKDLFYKFGVKRVSIEEICQKSNVSKMTFYKHFSNKVDLFHFILKRLYEQSFEKYDVIVQSDESFQIKLQKMSRLKEQYMECLSKEMLVELVDSPHPQIKELIESQKAKNIAGFMMVVKQAQEKHELRPDISPEFVLYMMNHLMELSKDPQLLSLYDNAQDLTLEITNFMFYGLGPINEE